MGNVCLGMSCPRRSPEAHPSSPGRPQAPCRLPCAPYGPGVFSPQGYPHLQLVGIEPSTCLLLFLGTGVSRDAALWLLQLGGGQVAFHLHSPGAAGNGAEARPGHVCAPAIPVA